MWVNLKTLKLIFIFALFFPLISILSKESEDPEYKLAVKLSQYYNQKKYEAVIFLGKASMQKSRNTNKKLEEYLINAYAHQIEALIDARQAETLLQNNQILQAKKMIDTAREKSPFTDLIINLKSKIDTTNNNINTSPNVTASQRAELDRLIHSGQTAINQGKDEEALGLFAKALLINPASTSAIEGYNLAIIRTNKGNSSARVRDLLSKSDQLILTHKYPEALSTLDETLTYDPINTYAINKKNEINTLIKKMAQVAQKEELTKEYLQEAKSLREQNEYAQAVEKYNLGYGLLPEFADWKKLIKETERNQKENEDRAFSKSLDDIAKSYQKGMYYIAVEEFAKAITEFETVITISKKYGQKQTIQQAEQFLQKARDNFKRKEEEIVSATNPYYKMINNTKILGINAFREKQFSVAKEYFNSILDLFPKNKFAMIYYLKCDIELKPGSRTQIIDQFIKDISLDMEKEPHEAKRLLMIAMDLDPKNPELLLLSKKINKTSQNIIKKSNIPAGTLEAWYQQAFNSFTQENDAKKANDLLTRIISEDPTFIKAVTLKARIEGRMQVTLSKTISPEAQKYYSEGLWHYGQGRIQEAKNSFEQAIKIDPEYQNAKNAREKCMKYLQQTKGS